jgi:ComF family protein
MPSLTGIKDVLLDFFLPQTCPACKRDIGGREALCAECRLRLVPAEPPWCRRCAEPLSSSRPHCAHCSSRLFACSLIRAAFLYRAAAPPLVHAFKYQGRVSACKTAGSWMAEALGRFPELGSFDALVPVPLHPKRLRERGYNQAGLLAAELSVKTGLPRFDLLIRNAATKPQWTLDRKARLRNVAGAFSTVGNASKGRFLLIDDVCTSGASLEGCAEALREAGAAKVYAYVFARQTDR